MASVNRRVLPGFSLSLGYTVFYLSLLVLLPIAACFFKGNTAAHPPDHAKKHLAARAAGEVAIEQNPRLHVVGNRGVRRHQQTECRGHHADHGDRLPVQ